MERTSYRLEDGERPSIAVINAIADHESSLPDEIRPQLYDAVDPDALDSLFEPRVDGELRRGGRAVFTYRGYRVTYESDGWIHVNDDQDAVSGTSETPADE
ncbi:HalOD1 output domain-containing protein [Haladaptatus sp. DFWS20]|uniref:HalOD1 output domain-containing protein n=1 Tax=Haladaptatus sp. DFWS20 TaxID=3403467 RepID=UPI003EC0FA55